MQKKSGKKNCLSPKSHMLISSFFIPTAASLGLLSAAPEIRDLDLLRRQKYETSRQPTDRVIDIPYLSLEDTARLTLTLPYTNLTKSLF